MAWTKDSPVKPGWYGVRLPSYEPQGYNIIHVVGLRNGLSARVENLHVRLDEFHIHYGHGTLWWDEPLELPWEKQQ